MNEPASLPPDTASRLPLRPRNLGRRFLARRLDEKLGHCHTQRVRQFNDILKRRIPQLHAACSQRVHPVESY
jgi:hypothetical protein